ncbi:conserved hypothetical protein [Trichinella spiralis]|uniref:hypothetical protein n=1 Tax=Trichinella spiralis TaxID=6334 RepID=UPI0001EFE938|nr:conserved hypothetical protein [Trichinella spiralis]
MIIYRKQNSNNRWQWKTLINASVLHVAIGQQRPLKCILHLTQNASSRKTHEEPDAVSENAKIYYLEVRDQAQHTLKCGTYRRHSFFPPPTFCLPSVYSSSDVNSAELSTTEDDL